MDEDTQRKKPATLNAQMKDEMVMPAWVFLSFVFASVSTGMVGGMTLHHKPIDVWVVAGTGLLGFLAPFIPVILKRLRRSATARNEEAVSPVVGVILMVAITVVLAAVVFVAVTKLSQNHTTEAPTLTFKGEDYGKTWVVLQADRGLDWSEFTVTGCTTVPTGSVDAGDSMTGCTPPVDVVHTATNTLVFRSGAA